jgi:peptide/nickel transport system permease protein
VVRRQAVQHRPQDRRERLELLRDITLPATSLMILGIAADSRFGRASMLETLNQDYIRTARAKGVREKRVVWKHALRNALIPLVTLWALNLSALLGGAVVTESIFSWPGLGPAFLQAITNPTSISCSGT